MIDLKNCTFIIPVRIESEDRMRNVITVLCYILENFDTKVILKEVDVESVFQEAVLPQIKEYLGEDVSEFLSNDFNFDILDNKSKIYDAQYGHVQFVDRKSYIDAGMENENFRGSSPEDKERFYRFKKMGYNVGRINHQVYHLEHSRGRNSWPNSVQGNPYMKENFEVWQSMQNMSGEELREYYSNQEYLKKYVNC